MTKIIHILPHSPPPAAYQCGPEDLPPLSSNPSDKDYAIKIDKPPYWICFAQNDFHAKLAYATLENTNEFEIECWRPYRMAPQVFSKNIKGVFHRLFPSYDARYGRYKFGERSKLLVDALRKEISEGNIIVHLHGLHDHTTNRILRKIDFSNTPVIATQRGGAHPSYYLSRRPWSLAPYLLAEWLGERLTFDSIDNFIIQSKVEYEYIKKAYTHKQVSHLQDGLNFSEHKEIKKQIARNKLGISSNSKILLYVGKIIRERGAHNVLWAYQKLKSKNTNYELYCVGVNESDELYPIFSKIDCHLIPRQTVEELVYYYSAADVSIYPPDRNEFDYCVDFAGISNFNIESLAHNTPVLTSLLFHFLGTDEEKKLLGLEYQGRDNMVSQILEIVNNEKEYSNCREISRKYYDRHKNTLNIINNYRHLENKYDLK